MRSLSSKRFQNLACALAQTTAKTPRGHRDRLDFASGALHIVIHHQKIILRVTLHFLPGPFQPSLNGLFRVLPSRPQPPFQFFLRWRKNEDGDRVGQLLFYLFGALHVNFQHQVQPLALRLLQPPARRAVSVLSENARVFQELPGANPAIEFLFGNKIIPFSGAFRGTGRPGCARYRKHRARHFQHFLHQRGFSRPRRSGHDEHQRLLCLCQRHSTFCACSRSFSISDFTSSARPVIARPSDSTPGVLESNVFASRCISCKRKSSFFPASPAPASNFRNCSTWLRNRASSSLTSLRSASSAASCARRMGSICTPFKRSSSRSARRRAMAGRTRSVMVSISAALAAICSRSPCISTVSACPSDRRMVSSLFSACSRQASTCSPSLSCFSSLCSSLAAPGAATTPGSRNSATKSGSVFTLNSWRNRSTAFM